MDAKLTGSERARLASPGPIDPEAHEAYLRGKHLYEFGDSESLRRALAYFEAAIAKQPDYPLALVGARGRARVPAGADGRVGQRVTRARRYARAQAALDKACGSTPQLADAHSAPRPTPRSCWPGLGGAEAGFKRAIALNGDLSRAHEEYAWLLAARGRTDEAAVAMRRALRLDPLSPFTTAGIARDPSTRGACPRRSRPTARARAQPAAGAGARRPGHGPAAASGDTDAAIRVAEAAASSARPRARCSCPTSRTPTRAAGKRTQAIEVLARWEDATRSRFPRREQAAHVYGALGDLERAFPLLEKAVADRSPGAMWLRVDPRYDALRRDPRFKRFLSRSRARSS